MGRARRQKIQAAEPSRGTWPPELRDLQRRGGMSPDWHEATHSMGRGVGSLSGRRSALLSPFFADDLPGDLGRRALSSQERKDLLASMIVPDGEVPTRDDPVVRAILEGEWRRVREEDWARRYENNPEQLFDTWEKEVLGALPWRSNQMGRRGARPTVHWWPNQQSGQHRLCEMPSSLLAAAVRRGDVHESELSRLLEERHDALWIEDNVLPELQFLAGRSPSFGEVDRDEDLLGSLWKSVQVVAGGRRESNDLDLHHNLLLEALGDQSGFFAASPVAGSFDFRGVHQEAWRNFPWHISHPGSADLDEVARIVMVQQITRIYYGVEKRDINAAEASSTKMREWEEFASGKSPNPLFTLRPLFQGEGQEELFAELLLDIEGASDKLPKTVFLEDVIAEGFSADVALRQNFSSAIAEAIRHYLNTL